MKRLLALVSLGGFSLAIQAGPNINVGTVYDYLDGDKSTYLKRVFNGGCLLYTSPSPRDGLLSRMPSSA